MKPPAKEPQPAAPWKVPHTEPADVFAVQALIKGNANQGQQQRAYDYIVRVLCETERMTFWPGGEDGRRSTDFAEGKRWVGLQLRRMERMRPEMPRENG